MEPRRSRNVAVRVTDRGKGFDNVVPANRALHLRQYFNLQWWPAGCAAWER